MIAPADMNLDELRAALAPLLAAHAAFDGWSETAIARAAAELGVPADRARLAYPKGAAQMIDAWFDATDQAMLAAFPATRIDALKIRERIHDLILFRIEAMAPQREALRRALGVLAMPQNLAEAARLAWRGADRIWRLAGDTATDFNHYSKRAILIAVYGSTSLVFLDDDSEGLAATRDFLDRRIGDVMRFEKAKARWKSDGRRMPSLSRFLGRLRYPAV
ncbi:MAG: ubiquinone biosynthesis protein [Sphingomonadales bacterium]|jgi:ubiquinone biosynthesis protein COQ9|nr:ubiquinone biosynthesis protein [Sphingomonadales bacterium]MEA3045768.1 ubiquinone biosynthesis protein [Sphingomonadales bacterium]